MRWLLYVYGFFVGFIMCFLAFNAGHTLGMMEAYSEKEYFIEKHSLEFNFGEEKSAIIRKEINGVDNPGDWIKF